MAIERRNIWVALGLAIVLGSLIITGYLEGNAILVVVGILGG